jgi:hypothetical protein
MVNPALMRGPKPVKAEPPVVEEVAVEEAIEEAVQDEAAPTEDSQVSSSEPEAE